MTPLVLLSAVSASVQTAHTRIGAANHPRAEGIRLEKARRAIVALLLRLLLRVHLLQRARRCLGSTLLAAASRLCLCQRRGLGLVSLLPGRGPERGGAGGAGFREARFLVGDAPLARHEDAAGTAFAGIEEVVGTRSVVVLEGVPGVRGGAVACAGGGGGDRGRIAHFLGRH
ncbi:hypothetical protein F5Y04DRAFT_286611, partial [Hypomontagnella monticulosa]